MTLLNIIEIAFQFTILIGLVSIAIVLFLRIFNWRFPRRWMYWPLYHFNNLADKPPDHMEKVFEKIQAVRVRHW